MYRKICILYLYLRQLKQPKEAGWLVASIWLDGWIVKNWRETNKNKIHLLNE